MPKEWWVLKVDNFNFTNNMFSKMFTLSLPDWSKGLLMAIGGGVLYTVQQSMTQGGLSAIDWMTVLNVGVLAGVTYLIKQYFTDSNGKLFGAI